MKQWIYVLIIGVLLLGIGTYAGYQLKKCPPSSTNTVHIIDTVWKEIPVVQNHYIIKLDTVVFLKNIPILPTREDTLRILADYYAKHVYTRTWQDSLLIAVQTDTITQNKIFPQKFTYKILRPQTIINTVVDNSITYNSYVSLGITGILKDPKWSSVDLTYQWQRGYVGATYLPYQNSFGVRAGAVLFKLKKVK